MKNLWRTLTTPQEWSVVSVVMVGLAALWALGVLAGAAFDARFCW